MKRGERGPPCSTHSSQLSSSTSAAGLVSGPSDAGDVGRVLTHPGDVLVTSVGSRSKTIHLQISPRRCPVPGQVYKGSWLRSACSKTSFAVRVVEGKEPNNTSHRLVEQSPADGSLFVPIFSTSCSTVEENYVSFVIICKCE